jgi:extradiol dioxygenase family protein
LTAVKPNFHLSVGVRSLEESVDFFVRIMKGAVSKGAVSHRDPSGYVNIDLFGNQITLKQAGEGPVNSPDFHFGLNLPLEQFENIANCLQESGHPSVVMQPKLIDAGTSMERKKMYLKCPTGYLIELKGYP